MTRGATIAALIGTLFWAGVVVAQDRPGRLDPKGCAPGERLHAGERVPRLPETTGENPSERNPSDKLARTDGVICPPNVDPHMSEPPPAAGAIKVIPPPGSSGGDLAVRPK